MNELERHREKQRENRIVLPESFFFFYSWLPLFSFVEIKFVVQLGSYQWGNGMHSLWHLRFIFFGISNSSRVQDDIDQVRMSS